ncbi:MAG: T9SS type A sorting domain-containing protein [Sediminibacterium sp.]|nr:T9SS type A sorting domain-containing protein [Sediminibacterium sp.]
MIQKRLVLLLGLLMCYVINQAQNSPLFGTAIPVIINGYTFDAMEPFLSPDGNALFFNSLNDGISTSLHYAAKVNDSVFNYLGPVPVVNQTVTPRLDAVASVDSLNTFYWVSTRGYPANYENVFKVKFLTSSYTGFGRVHGDFYIQQPGHLVMDAMVTQNGNTLVYCNAFFNGCPNGLPCKSSMGMATKVNDSTFNKLSNTAAVFANVNDTVNYLVYAPHVLPNGLELYYTRLQKGGTQTEVMVATRTTTNAAFSNPAVLIPASLQLPEAPTLSADGQRLYYHRKQGAVYQVFLKKRLSVSSAGKLTKDPDVMIRYMASGNRIKIEGLKADEDFTVELMDVTGRINKRASNRNELDISDLPEGILILKIIWNEQTAVFKVLHH